MKEKKVAASGSMNLKIKKIIYYVLSVILSIAVFFSVFWLISEKKSRKIIIECSDKFSEYTEIYGDISCSGSFIAPQDSINGIMIYALSVKDNPDVGMTVRISDSSGNEMISVYTASSSLLDNGWSEIVFTENVDLIKGSIYEIELSAENADSEFPILVGICETEEGSTEGKICMRAFSYSTSAPLRFAFLPAAVLALVVLLMLLINAHRRFDDDFIIMKDVKWYDWLFFGFIFVFSTLFFGQTFDLPLTAMQAYDLWEFSFDGNFFSFYTCVKEKALSDGYLTGSLIDGAYYNILDYIILAIPLLPVYIIDKLFKLNSSPDVCLIVSKLFLMTSVMLSGYLLFRLGKKLGFTPQRARIMSYIYLSSPVLILATTEFGQIDIFSIIFILLSLFFYIDKKYTKFSLIMAVAIALKALAVFAFLPLILFAEKDIGKLLKYLLLSFSVTIATRIMFIFDSGYSETKTFMNSNYGFSDKITKSCFISGSRAVSYFIFFTALVIVIAFYLKSSDEGSHIRMMVYAPLLIFSIFTIFIEWHPQWISNIVPFMTLAVFMIKDSKLALYLDSIFSLSFILVTGLCFPKNVDNYLVNGCLIPMIFGQSYKSENFSSLVQGFLNGTINITVILQSALCAAIVALCIVIVLSCRKNGCKISDETVIEREIAVLRMSTLLILNLFYLTLYFVK